MSGVSADSVVNKNFLSPLGFKFLLKRAPGIEFFVQAVTMPGLALPAVDTPNPFVTLPYGGDHISYDELELTFRVDEDMKSWLEIHDWIRDTGFPEKFEQYANIASQDVRQGLGLKSDVVLVILNSVMRGNIEVTFHDAFPVSLSGFELTAMDEDVTYIKSTARFRYTRFSVKRI